MTYEEQVARFQAAKMQIKLGLDVLEPVLNSYDEYDSFGCVNAVSLETAMGDIEGALKTFTAINENLCREQSWCKEEDYHER